MSNSDDTPKKQLELSGSGTGGRKRTAVGAGDDGEGEGPKELPGSSDYPSFEFLPRVVICEPHLLMSAGMKRMIPFCHVIGEATESSQALVLVKALQPDLVITELEVSGMDGIELCKRIRETSSRSAILISTHSYNATKFFHQVMRSGAGGIYLKRKGREELVKAVVATLKDQPYCDETVSRLVNQHPPLINSLDEGLTINEIDVLIRLDLRNREIADELGLQLKKVEKLILSILGKLNVETLFQAALKAVNLGITLIPVMPRRDSVTGLNEDEEMALALCIFVGVPFGKLRDGVFGQRVFILKQLRNQLRMHLCSFRCILSFPF